MTTTLGEFTIKSLSIERFGTEVQDSPYSGTPMKINNSDGFVAYLKTEDQYIYQHMDSHS